MGPEVMASGMAFEKPCGIFVFPSASQFGLIGYQTILILLGYRDLLALSPLKVNPMLLRLRYGP
jgi:hypothetical protein